MSSNRQEGFKVGTTVRGAIPCIIVDGDSVLCEFTGSEGMEQARIVCNALNAAHAASSDLQRIS